jgi:hypothetical protein
MKYDLSRYWNHQDIEDKRKLRKTTQKALVAIKQSAKALANRGMHHRNHRPHQKVVIETATLPFKKRKCYVEMEAASTIVASAQK